MTKSDFVNLHAHSCLSVGDGFGYPEDHFSFALENGMNAMAITEHGNMNSMGYMFQAQSSLKKKGVPFKPIFGVEAYYHPDLDAWQKLKDGSDEEESNDLVVEIESESKNSKWANPLNRRHHLIILVQNKEGYKNLCKIISASYRKGFYRFPRVDFKTLEKHHEGLIISSACLAGIPSFHVFQNYEKGDEEVFKALDKEFLPLLQLFGKDRANIEIQFNKMPEQLLCNKFLIEYSKRSGFPLLATADSHYSRPDLWKEREMYRLLAQQTKGYNVSIADLPKTIDELKCELYPKNFDQMFETYLSIYPDSTEELDEIVVSALHRSTIIAYDQIEDVKQDNSMKLPKSFLKGENPDDKLKKLCNERLQEIDVSKPEKYKQRLDFELDVIIKKGFSLYFLTLKEALDKIRETLLVGAGRGSGAGSLVCYLLGITSIDPIEHNLLFERFLSENRNEPPDIDNDIEDRDAALEILRNHFGHDNVVAISNMNSLQLKSLVKDISKFYQIPFEEVNAVTSVMEKEAKQPILDSVGGDQKLYVFDFDGAYKFSPTFKSFIDKHPDVAKSIKLIFKQIKSIGRHAGGVIITENPDEFMPIIRIRGVDQTPWGEGLTAKHLEPMGLIKYDFLGIATLRIIRRCIERILIKNDIEVSPETVQAFFDKYLSPDSVGQGKEEVFREIYHKGKFCGTFQFAEKNAQEFCKNAEPLSINDISAITSIYRPGPLAGKADKKYVHLVKNPEDVDLYHPVIKEVLGDTYGLLVYQEQFMLLAHKLAGFTLTESDELRKLLVKPLTSMGDEMKRKRIEVGEKFINGCVSNGISYERAKTLWEEEILGFISYGFNKSHAVSYAYLSYQCAYLFYYHPDEWVCSYLENDTDKEKAVAEVQAVGYSIRNLDIISSGTEYSVLNKEIYPPFSSVKGIGNIAIQELLEKRKDWSGSGLEGFMSFFYDIEQKTLKNGKVKTKHIWKFSKFNKRALDGLIKLEALNGLKIFPSPFLNHSHLRNVLIENWADKEKQLFDLEKLISECSTKDFTDNDRVNFQAELLGTYDKSLLISPDVVDFLRENDIVPLAELAAYPQSIWFILKDFEVKSTQKGKPYFKLQIMDIDGAEMFLNYFYGEPRDGFAKKGVYWAEIFQKNGFINTARNSFIRRIS